MSLQEIKTKVQEKAKIFFSQPCLQNLNIEQFIQSLYDHLLQMNQIEILDYISSGSYGIVFKVFRTSEFAMKVMVESQETLDEMGILKKVKHLPYCLRIETKTIAKIQGIDFDIIVTQLAKKDLESFILEYKQQEIPKEIQFKIITQCLIGLHSIHNKYPRIIHRDIKPSNILLDENGDVIIADFGLACEIKDSDYRKDRLGTVLYFGPELHGEQVKYNEKNDIFAMGCIFAQINNTKLISTNYVTEYIKKINAKEIKIEGYSALIIELINNMTVVDQYERFSARDCLRMMDPLFDFQQPEGDDTIQNQYKAHQSFIKKVTNIQQDKPAQQSDQQSLKTVDINLINDELEKLKQINKELQENQSKQKVEQIVEFDDQQNKKLLLFGCVGLFKFLIFLILMVVAIMNQTHQIADSKNIGVILVSIVEFILGACIVVTVVLVKFPKKQEYQRLDRYMKYYFGFSIAMQLVHAQFTNLNDRKGQNDFIVFIIIIQIIIHSPLFRLNSLLQKIKNQDKKTTFYIILSDLIGVYSECHCLAAISLHDKYHWDILNQSSSHDMKNTLIASAVFYSIFRAISFLQSNINEININYIIYNSRAFMCIDRILLILECCYFSSDYKWQGGYSLTFYIVSSLFTLRIASFQGPYLLRKQFLVYQGSNEQSIQMIIYSIISNQVGSILIILYSRFSLYEDLILDFGIAMGCILIVVAVIENFDYNFQDRHVWIKILNLSIFACLLGLTIKSGKTYENVLAFSCIATIIFLLKAIIFSDKSPSN